jgi:nitronate monooxygenase
MKLADFPISFRNHPHLLPVIGGGMGVNISTAELALELARLGGAGHISDAMSPFVSDQLLGTKFHKTKRANFKGDILPDGNPDAKWTGEEVYRANKGYCEYVMNKKGSKGAVFVNVMEKLNMGNPTETLQARLQGAMDGGIDGITLSAGLHQGSLKLVADHPRFHDVLFGIIVSSSRALRIFLRGAERAGRMPDYVIVEGPLAGGHLGFGEDWANYTLEGCVTDVIEYLRENSLQIPVIAAGGVFTGGDALRMLSLGAAGVQVATRFTISQECGLPKDVKQIYAKAEEEDVEVNLYSPTGYPMRMLKSSPCLKSNIRPNCAALGYILDKEGKCSYQNAYMATPEDENGKKLPIVGKMCICYHFMKFTTYTCGQNVTRLKSTMRKNESGLYELPRAEEIFMDYAYSNVDEKLFPAVESWAQAV